MAANSREGSRLLRFWVNAPNTNSEIGTTLSRARARGAQLIDKDRNPKWSPSSLAEVTAAEVEAYFAPVDDDLKF